MSTAPDLFQPFLAFMQNAAHAQQRGEKDRHALWLEAASHLHGIDDDAIQALSQQLLDHGRHADAIALTGIAAQLRVTSAAASFQHGYALQIANRHQEALAPYRHAFRLAPDFPQLRNNLAIAIRSCGGGIKQESMLLEQAVIADPRDANAWINLTSLNRTRMLLDRALSTGARAVEIAPTNPLALNNYALALKEAQRWDEAEQCAKAACAFAPDDPTMRFNLAILHLVRGNYAQGWPLHEARWEGAPELGNKRPLLPGPQWQGQSLKGKTLLLWGEQGMGDLLQFCRYVPLLAKRVHAEGGRLAWNTFPQMGDLLRRNLGLHVDAYSEGGSVATLPPFDYEISLLSLPLMLGANGQNIPSATPYLHPDAAAAADWRTRLGGEKRLRVGLTWTGNPQHARNAFRSVSLQRYAGFFKELGNVAFYSLQPGASEDVTAAREAGFEIADHADEFRHFDDTAAFIDALDLVVTVCTSIAHLAGALGKRTWVLLDTNPHWVWLLNKPDSGWYPSTRLYRQAQFAQWDPVLAEVTRDLQALSAQHTPGNR